MEPYQVHLDDWTVGLCATDDGRLTFKVTNIQEKDYLTRLVGEVRFHRHYVGSMCAGLLYPSPFTATGAPYRRARTKEEILSAQGCG